MHSSDEIKKCAGSADVMGLEEKYVAKNYAPTPVVISHGQGVEVWDPEGKRYLDFLSGIAAVSQGHCHPRLIRALTDQAQRLTLISRAFFSDRLGPFAKFATELFGFDRILMMNTGVEAVETAIKLCRKWGYEVKGIAENQAKIIFCENNFHGRTLGAISASSSPASRGKFGPFVPNFVLIPFNDLGRLEEALKDPDVCGFVVEPIQGEGGVVVPTEGYLKGVRDLCTKYQALFVADEVQTGIGRTGKLLACQHENVKPDIVCLGKALTGGVLPASAILADDAVMLCFKPGDHGSTFSGNPLACAVAHEALRVVVEERLTENAEERGQSLRSQVGKFSKNVVQEIRGKGLLNAIVLSPSYCRSAEEVCLELKDRGMLAKATKENVFRLAPPLVITQAQIDLGVAILKQVLGE